MFLPVITSSNRALRLVDRVGRLAPDILPGFGFLSLFIDQDACDSSCYNYQQLLHKHLIPVQFYLNLFVVPWAYQDLNLGPLRYQRSALTA